MVQAAIRRYHHALSAFCSRQVLSSPAWTPPRSLVSVTACYVPTSFLAFPLFAALAPCMTHCTKRHMGATSVPCLVQITFFRSAEMV